MSRFAFLLIFLAAMPALGQISPEKMASGRLDRSKWQKAGQGLHKSISKDSLDPETHYLLALYFFSNSNPAYNIDSAYRYSKSSWTYYRRTSGKDRERLRKVPMDSLHLSQLTSRIDSVAFERAKKTNTEVSYQYFIDRYTTAPQRKSAIELRDEVAFLEALKANRWQSFQKFMTQYPGSHRGAEAQSRYDKLLFEDKTRDHLLASYIKFHQQFPGSPYAGEAEKNIFELSTLSGSVESFRWFVTNYPSSPWSRRAKNILYKIQSAGEVDAFDATWMTDSLKQIEKLNELYWVPVIKSGRFGFMDENGREVIAPRFDAVSEDYLCGDVHDRLLATSEGLIARNEMVLWKGHVTEAKEIGLGYNLITTDSGKFVLHESGFRIGAQPVDNAQVVANQFIGLSRNKKWGIYSLVGKALLPFSLDDITVFDSLIVFTKGGKKIITRPDRISKVTDKAPLKEDFVFDDVRRWGPQHYWVRNGPLEGVLDASLNFLIPLDRQVLRKMSFGFLRGKDDKVYIKGLTRFENTPYKSVNEQGGWVRMQTVSGNHVLYDKSFDRQEQGDSAWFQGQLAFLQSGDSVRAFLPSGQKLSFYGRSFLFKEFRDSTAWLVLDDKKKKSVYDATSGARLFTSEFDQIEPMSPSVFLITKAGKKGLISEDGKVLLPIEYDAIISTSPSTYSLLKDKKFGWYDAGSKLLVKPVYDRNIKVYNQRLRLAYKEKGYGFILPDGKPLGLNEWEDVQFWTDSVAWVKKNFHWTLININSQKPKLDKVRNFTSVMDTPTERIYIVRQENAFGVLSTRKGIVVPIQYSDILNLGSKEVPLYFTERHIEEAGISVVVYYDAGGKIIRRQAMETDEFERISCDN